MQQGQQQRQQVLGDEPRALGRGVNAVRLDGSGQVVDACVEHGQQRHVIFLSHAAVHFIELMNVVLAVVGRQRDAGQQHGNVRGAQAAHQRAEVALGHIQRKAAQPVVAAELDDDGRRMQPEHARQAVECVFGGVAAHAGVDDAVVISARGQVMLQENRIGLAWVESVTGGDAVSKTHHQRLMGGGAGNTGKTDGKADEQQPEA